MLGSSLQWMPDQKTLLVKLVPANAGPPPAASAASDGPSIQETTGEKGESSTYETRDTLSSKHDEDLFDYYATSQLAFVDARLGRDHAARRAGDHHATSTPSPDGEHLLVEVIHKPYSYVTTYPNFAHDVEVWDRAGRRTRTLAKLPLADRVPIAGVPTGPRDFEWRPTEPATLVWAEALDGGDWNVEVPARDKVMMQRAPFTDAARRDRAHRAALRRLRLERAAAASRSSASTTRTSTGSARSSSTSDDPAAKPSLVWDMSSDERYKDPGRPVYKVLPNGQWVVRQEGDAIFLARRGRVARRRSAVPRSLRPRDRASPSGCSAATRPRSSRSWRSPARPTARS